MTMVDAGCCGAPIMRKRTRVAVWLAVAVCAALFISLEHCSGGHKECERLRKRLESDRVRMVRKMVESGYLIGKDRSQVIHMVSCPYYFSGPNCIEFPLGDREDTIGPMGWVLKVAMVDDIAVSAHLNSR